MKLRKIVLFVGLMAIFVMLAPGSQVWAGAGPEPPEEGADIHGPEIWGVVVCDNTLQVMTVRLKRVEDCLVKTETYVEAWPHGCPADETAALGYGPDPADEIHFFLLPGTPYVTKVKNFKIEGTRCSFDAQFMFWEP